MMNIKVFTVSQINRYIKSLFEKDVLLNGFFVEAEISNFKNHSSGHFYFTLKDSDGAINCVMFRGSALNLKFMPENGMKVIAYGSASVYEKTGQYQIYVELLEPAGKGALYAAYEQLKQRLQKEGLFDAEHKKKIEKFPDCVAVVTSKTGAVIKDIINVIKRRNKGVKIVLVPVSVQGEEAPSEIADAIRLINEWGGADTIITGRGGGSLEDLWAFNDERVCYAVFESKIPVISAVGHETDVTLVDFVADLRAPTPSAAAELAVADLSETKERLYSNVIRLNSRLDYKIINARTRLNYNLGRPPLKRPFDKISAFRSDILKKHEMIYKAVISKIERKRALLEGKIDNLDKASPLNILKRGYSLVYNGENRLITDSGDVSVNEMIKIKLKAGTLYSIVKLKEEG